MRFLSISSYNIIAWNEIRLNNIKISSNKNEEKGASQVFIRDLTIKINNWFAFIITCILFYLLNVNSFLFIIRFLSGKFIGIHINGLNCYIKTKKRITNEIASEGLSILKLTHAFSDICVSDAFVIFEVQLGSKLFFFGLQVGFLYLNNEKGNTCKLLLRRSIIRYKELDLFGLEDHNTLKDPDFNLKKLFVTLFNQNSSCRLFNIPGVINIKISYNINKISVMTTEDYFDEEFCGIYLSFMGILRLFNNLGLQNYIKNQIEVGHKNCRKFQISFILKKLKFEDLNSGVIIFNDLNYYFDFESSGLKKLSVEIDYSFISFQMSYFRLAEIFGLKAMYEKVDHIFNIEFGLVKLHLYNNIIFNEFTDYCKIVEIPSVIFLVIFDFSNEQCIKCLLNTDISGSLISLNNSGVQSYVNNKNNIDKELLLLTSEYFLTSIHSDLFFEIESENLSEATKRNELNVEFQVTFSSEIEIIDESSTISLNFGNGSVGFIYNSSNIELNAGKIYILFKRITNSEEVKFIEQKISSLVFKSFKTIENKVCFNRQVRNIEICDYSIEINNKLSIKCSRVKFINLLDGSKTLRLNSICLKYKLPVKWEIRDTFLSARATEASIESISNLQNFERISVSKLVMYEESNRYPDICHKLLNFKSNLNIYNYSNLHNIKIHFEFPEIKLNISKNNILNISELFFVLKKEITCKNSLFFVEKEKIMEFTFKATTINIFENYGNKYIIFTIYNEKSVGNITLNRDENNTSFNINKMRLFIGEKEMRSRLNLIDFPFANETTYFLIEKSRPHEIICYEFLEKENLSYYFTEANEIGYFEDLFYPILFFELDIFLNLKFERVDGFISKTYFNVGFDQLQLTSGVYIVLDIVDILKLITFFGGNNETKQSGLLFNILDIDHFSLISSSITLILLNSQLEKKDKISINIEKLKVFRNKVNCNLWLDKFRICFFSPSKNVLGQQIGIYIDDFHEISKFYTGVTEINEILNIDLLNLGFDYYNNKVMRVDMYVNIAKLTLTKEFLDNINDNIDKFFVGNCSYDKVFIVRHSNHSPLRVFIRNIRQCPNYNNNIIKSSKNQLFLLDYLGIYCLLENLKLSYRNFDLNLNFRSKYLVELDNTSKFNCNNIINNYSYYRGYFINNSYLDSTIKFSSNKNILSKYRQSLVSFENIKGNYYSGSLLFGINIKIISEIKRDLGLFFSSNSNGLSNLHSYHYVSENKYFECSLDFLVENNHIYICQKENRKDYNNSIATLKDSINFLNIFDSVTSSTEYFYCDYKIIDSNFQIGVECFKDNKTIFIKLFNIVNLVNISGIKLHYCIFSTVFSYQLNNFRESKPIENFSVESIMDIDYNEELCLIIENSKNNRKELKISLEKNKSVTNNCFDLTFGDYSYNKGFFDFNNKLQLNICIFFDKHRFYIIIWPSAVVFNLTCYDFILNSIVDEQELYCICKRKYAHREKILPYIAILGKHFQTKEKKKLLLFTVDDSIKYEFDVLHEHEDEFSNLIVDYNNNISIKINNYNNFIKDETIFGIIQRSSLKIRSISIEPYWSITNNSSFKLDIFSNNNIFSVYPSVGYLDNIGIFGGERTNEYNKSNHLIVRFHNFITNYVIDISNKDSFSDVINLYYSNNPSNLWEVVEITVTINNSAYDFHPEYSVKVSDFNEEKCGNYYILKNKTKNSYLLSQINRNFDFKRYLTFHKMGDLQTEIWKNTFLEKIAYKVENESKRNNIDNDSTFSSIYLFPDYVMDNKLVYWGNDLGRTLEKLILIEYFDGNNNRIELDRIYLTDNRSTKKRFNYGFFDPKNNIKFVQFEVNIIRFENGIIQIYFRDLSLISIHTTPNPPFFSPNNCLIPYFSNMERKIEFEININIRDFKLILGTVISEGIVIFKRDISTLSHIGTPKNLFPIFPPRIDSEILKLIPSVELVLSKVKIILKRNKLLELDDLGINYFMVFYAKNLDFTVFRGSKAIMEIANKKHNYLPLIRFSILEGIKTRFGKFSDLKRYHVYDLNLNLPSLNVNLKLNDYLGILISKFMYEKEVHIWNSNSGKEKSGVVIYFNTCDLFVQRITINNMLFLLNYRDSIKTPLKLHLENIDVLFSLIRNKTKVLVKSIIKSMLLKRINSVVNLIFLND
ncbi:hypothetical protein FG379_002698 [Cryptosporidium bovis]|uniref:uncharacterized protein n=1 Tax=Cryptosporidium bovis TaxID=310047 RepID=UPI00351A26A0|nr:hypothetical protein FG379_002698 [Cryptosporidium bovis]